MKAADNGPRCDGTEALGCREQIFEQDTIENTTTRPRARAAPTPCRAGPATTCTSNDPGDQVIESVNAGTDAVFASVNYMLTSDVETLVRQGSATFGFGNGLANKLFGNGGNNTLDGDGGGTRA